MAPTLATDPEERFKKVVGAFAPVAPALTPGALKTVIDNSGADAVVDNLSAEVAKHSQLTQAETQPVVKAAVAGQLDSQAQANAVSQTAATAVSVQASVTLSDPVMLAPWFRAGGRRLLS